ncbi:MAG: STAS domain-containing protein [Thermoleophilia bacterium]|nr:STAS domain-containing protein [Thermoleophilia bacterium]
MKVFTLTELDLDGGHREIAVEGELDLAVAEQLQEALARSEAEQTLLDFEALEFIDSTGIAVIVQAHQRAAKEGRRVVVHSPRAQVLRVLTIAGLTENGLVMQTREQALSATAPAS